jgi:hypothetical protein
VNPVLVTLLLPLAVLIGFAGIAIGGRVSRSAVIVAAILAGVVVLLILVYA